MAHAKLLIKDSRNLVKLFKTDNEINIEGIVSKVNTLLNNHSYVQKDALYVSIKEYVTSLNKNYIEAREQNRAPDSKEVGKKLVKLINDYCDN